MRKESVPITMDDKENIDMYTAAKDRYEKIPYRRCGRSGLLLPALSLGLWHNFGSITPFEVQQSILRTAFDNGITHFDLANNYGPPYGEAERNFLKSSADNGRKVWPQGVGKAPAIVPGIISDSQNRRIQVSPQHDLCSWFITSWKRPRPNDPV